MTDASPRKSTECDDASQEVDQYYALCREQHLSKLSAYMKSSLNNVNILEIVEDSASNSDVDSTEVVILHFIESSEPDADLSNLSLMSSSLDSLETKQSGSISKECVEKDVNGASKMPHPPFKRNEDRCLSDISQSDGSQKSDKSEDNSTVQIDKNRGFSNASAADLAKKRVIAHRRMDSAAESDASSWFSLSDITGHRHTPMFITDVIIKEPSPCIADIETEYAFAIELRARIAADLAKTPDSAFLIESLTTQDCEIRKILEKSRMSNTIEYRRIKRISEKRPGDEQFFRKNLSPSEQCDFLKQMRAISAHNGTSKPYQIALLETDLPIKYKASVMHKINILESMERTDTEYHKLKHWIDAFMRVPFSKYATLAVSMSDGADACSDFLKSAKNTMDRCTYGMDDAKAQIMQLLGQWIVNPKSEGGAIGICGPPGTGKTSLIRDGVSKVLGRDFSFISLGGTGDSSFLNGSAYTYEGSTWGRIVQILMDSGTMNPVIYFDELDKVSDTPRGEEIINLLVHLTDVSQNTQFQDKYFSEIDFDVSRCLFIFSYNDESKVSPVLLDRMNRVRAKGYSRAEKQMIAQRHILPNIRSRFGFAESDIIVSDKVVDYIVDEPRFTRKEEGVRNMKRCLEKIHAQINLQRLLGQDVNIPYRITCSDADTCITGEELGGLSLSMYV